MRPLVRWMAVLCLLAAAITPAQQITLSGLRSSNQAGAFHGLRQDSSGNLYTLFDAQDGVRLLKFNSGGTQLLGQAQLGFAGDTGIALDLDATGAIYITGTSNSLGSIRGTAGTSFPNRADTTTNSFVARLTPALTVQWLTFCGSGKLAASGIAVNSANVYVTGSLYAATLPVTSAGIQQAPAPGSVGNGFVESFSSAAGVLQYATYLTGANGDTTPTAIAADSVGNTFVAGTTTATGYPTTAALVPTFRSVGGSNVSGFVTRLNPAGDGFVFSTFVPGNGLTSIALDASGSGSLLFSGDVARGLFPLTVAQTPIAPLLNYQTGVRLMLDGSSVLSSTLLAPGGSSVITAGPNGSAWVFGSAALSGSAPLLPVTPVESLGNAFALRIAPSTAHVDRASRFGGLPIANSGFARLPVTEGGVVVAGDGTVSLAGTASPTLSSDLLATQHFDLPFAAAPNTALPSSIHDALPPSSCNGSACSGGAGLLARLAPDASSAALALSVDDLPNLTLRNLGTATADNVRITSTGYTVNSACAASLAPAAECTIALTGTGPGSITVQATGTAAFTTSLPATTRTFNAIHVLPRELDYGIQTSSSGVATRTLTVRNLGTSTQTFASQSSDTGSRGYTVSETASTCTPAGDGVSKVLGPNGICTITLGVTSGTDAARDGAIAAHWQVGGSDVLLTGYAQAAALSLSASIVDFDRQFVGGLRSSRFLYLSNSSANALSHGNVASGDPAFAVVDECPATLQPHSICRIAFTYEAATAPSSNAMSLTVDGLPATVLGETLPRPSISGATTNPNLDVSATALTFQNAVTVTTASTETQTLSITNKGAAPFDFALAITGDFTFQTGCPATLAGSANCTAVVTFTPTGAGVRQGLLSVTAGSAGPAYVALSGTGTAILPAVNGSVDFGDVPLNTPAVQWLKVAQSFPSLTVASTDPSYTVLLVEDTGYGHGTPVASAYGANATGTCYSCYLGIQFTPLSAGAHAASLSITSPGNGKAAALGVTGNGAPRNGLILTPISQDFGPVPVHSSTASTVFQLTNGTAAAIAVAGSAITGDYMLSSENTGGASCAGASLQAGASCFVPVRFTPTAVGTRVGTLTVNTSAGQAASTLTGVGSDDSGVAFTPGELRFENVPGTAERQQTVTVTNSSSSAETVGIPSTSDTHFAATSTCGTLQPGLTCTITVTYAPTDAYASGLLTVPVSTAPAGAPSTTNYTLALSGLYTLNTAGLQIIPGERTSVNFGALPTNTISDIRILHVNNLGTQPLTLSVEAPRQFVLTSSTCAGLAANASCDLGVRYVPQTGGDSTGTLFVRGVPADGSATRDALGYLEGYGIGSGTLVLSGNISPIGVLAFGQVASGFSTSQTITLTNPSTAPDGTVITVRRIRSEFPYSSTTTCGAPLSRGASCAVTITYSPLYQVSSSPAINAPQTDTGTLTIESDAGNAPQFLDLNGSASAATVSSPSNVAPLSTFSLSQGSLYFPATAAGSASSAQNITVTNTGTQTVHILRVLPTSTSFTTTTDCGTLVPGAGCTISVVFNPQTAGTALASLEIGTDAGAALEFVTLAGEGSAAAASITPQTIDFGRVLVGQTVTQSATLTNTGSVPITIGSIVTSGADYTLAAAAGNACTAPGGTLAAGGSCTIAVAFTPSGAGSSAGRLSVATSATALPLVVALTGVGTQPQLIASAASLDFGSVLTGSRSTLALTLRNAGTAPVDGLVFAASPGVYTVATTCGITTIAAGSSCSVNVTFAPTAIGMTGGTLIIASNDPASPIVITLTGTGTQGGSFFLTANGAATATATVQTGLPATYTLSLTPTGGYSGVVALTCTADAPVQYAACSLVPSSVTLTTGAQASTATINTISASTTASLVRPSGFERAAALCMVPFAGVLILLQRRRVLPLFMLFCALASMTGCGSGGDARIRYVAPGTYTFHVTATSTNTIPASQTVTLTLVVTPRT